MTSEEVSFHLWENVKGLSINVFAKTPEELKDTLTGFASNADEIVNAWNDVKQVVIGKNILTTNAPATSDVPWDDETVCKHGKRNDLNGKRGQNGQLYKARYYCTSRDKNDQCKPTGVQA